MKFPLSIIFLFFTIGSALASAECGRHDDYGLPGESDHLVCKDAFILGYNPTHKVADWVMYDIDANSISGKQPYLGKFFADPEISSADQANNSLYYKSGYDRGHLAPNATIDYSTEAQLESFYFTNIAPQLPSLNRQGWAELEAHIRSCAYGSQSSLLVVTGPVYSEKVRWLNGEIRIPDGYFKVAVERQEPYRMAAFYMPNSKVSRINVGLYRVTVDKIEAMTGLDFYSRLPWTLQDKSESGGSGFCFYQGLSVEKPDAGPNESLFNVEGLLNKPVTSYSCEQRKTCSKMTSCDEAKFHFSQCGNSRLDGNNDGVPCESICQK